MDQDGTKKRQEFVKIRDNDQSSGQDYEEYIEAIGDTERLKYLKPIKFLGLKNIPKKLRILDICAGPGVAGMALEKHLHERGYEVENITFIDLNKERLERIPNDPRYTIIYGDALSFKGSGFHLAILRSGVYFFTPKEQRELFRTIRNALEVPGAFLFTTYGFIKESREALTHLHHLIFHPRFEGKEDIKDGRGLYEAPDVLAERICNQGFRRGTIVDLAKVDFTTQVYAKKYRLDREQRQRLKDYLNSLDFLEDDVVEIGGDGKLKVAFLSVSYGDVLQVRKEGRDMAFSVESYTAEFLTRKRVRSLKHVLEWADHLTYFYNRAGYPYPL